jgi:hypothetical protein
MEGALQRGNDQLESLRIRNEKLAKELSKVKSENKTFKILVRK